MVFNHISKLFVQEAAMRVPIHVSCTMQHLPCYNARDNKYAFLLNAVKYPAGSSGAKACVGLTTAVSDSDATTAKLAITASGSEWNSVGTTSTFWIANPDNTKHFFVVLGR